MKKVYYVYYKMNKKCITCITCITFFKTVLKQNHKICNTLAQM